MSIPASFFISGAILVLLLLISYALIRRLRNGVQEELLLHLTARFFLNKKDYRYINNLILPTEDETTQIDHILVTRFGIFLVETINLKGSVRGQKNDPRWTLHGNGDTQEIPNPLLSSARHVHALERIFGLRPEMIFPLIVSTADTEFKSEKVDNVIPVRGYRDFICSKKEPLLGDFEVKDLIAKTDKYIFETVRENYLSHGKNLDQEGMGKIRRKLKRSRPVSPVYKYAVIVVFLILFLSFAKKTFFSPQEPSGQTEVAELRQQQEQSRKREELNRVYQVQDSEGRTTFTNVATSADARLLDSGAEGKPSLPVQIVDDQVIVPVTLGNNGVEIHTSVILDRNSSRSLFTREVADFLKAEEVGVTRHRMGEIFIPMESRKVSYLKIGSIVENEFVFLAFADQNQYRRSILGRDFIDKHPFEIDEKRKLLIWK